MGKACTYLHTHTHTIFNLIKKAIDQQTIDWFSISATSVWIQKARFAEFQKEKERKVNFNWIDLQSQFGWWTLSSLQHKKEREREKTHFRIEGEETRKNSIKSKMISDMMVGKGGREDGKVFFHDFKRESEERRGSEKDGRGEIRWRWRSRQEGHSQANDLNNLLIIDNEDRTNQNIISKIN